MLTSSSEPLAPWRSPLSRALHRNRAQPFCRYLQLATVRTDGTPANRTVVFRGFLAQSNQLMFISDRRSGKIAQIEHSAAAEACWYFTKTREQFRLSGQLIVVSSQTTQEDLQLARKQTWQKISDSARLQFAWPQPKAPRTSDDDAFSPAAPSNQTPAVNFCLLLLMVNSVDYLELRGEPQRRHLYK
ncbi:MAG: Npun_F5749 family FMN-dependent PPOX-type flavoprotein, partial [Phormidesmis sp.]